MTERMRRVDEAMREVLSDAVAKGLKDPRVGFVTVTAVETSPDLRYARVYVSVLGDDAERTASLDGLRSAHGFLQRKVAGELRLKHTPQLDFAEDDTARRAARVDWLIAHTRGRARMTSSAVGVAATRDAILNELRSGGRFLLVTHEHPDGDALGSLIAMHGILTALGKDALMFMASDEFPLPPEYRFLELQGTTGELPADLQERVVVFLDCGNIDRTPVQAVKSDGSHILNIDHHHDNTLFGDVDLVVPGASCTAEIVWELMQELDVTPTPEIARALYVGLVTDTGQFMYENTTPRAHTMAGALIEAGVDAHRVYRELYEGIPSSKLVLLGRALDSMARYDDGRLTMVALTAEDFEEAGADESHSEGIIDHLRAVEGTKVAALARERALPDAPGAKKVSLRSSDGEGRRVGHRPGGRGRRPSPGGRLHDRDVRRRARRVPARADRQAARRRSDRVGRRTVDGFLLVDKPAGKTSHDVVAQVRRALRERGVTGPVKRGGVRVGHAGTLDPFATGLLIVLIGRATRVQSHVMGLGKSYETVARFGAVSTTGDRDGEIAETGHVPDGDLPLPTGDVRQRPPRVLGGQGRRKARVRPRPRGRGRRAARADRARHPLRRAVARRRTTSVRHRLLVGDVCAQPRRRSRRRLLRGAAPNGDRAVRRRRCRAARGPRSHAVAGGRPRAFHARRDARRRRCALARPWPAGSRKCRGSGAAHRRRRADRHRRAPRSGPVGARRRVPRVNVVSLQDAPARPRRAAVGKFDGVHLGHRRVIEGSDTVVTFDPQPVQVIAPAAAPKLLLTIERKAELVADLGVEELVVIPFDEAMSHQSPQAFIDEVLVERLTCGASRSARTSASATGPRATRRCCPPTTASRRTSSHCSSSTARSSPPATSAASSSAGRSSTPTHCSGRRSP